MVMVSDHPAEGWRGCYCETPISFGDTTLAKGSDGEPPSFLLRVGDKIDRETNGLPLNGT